MDGMKSTGGFFGNFSSRLFKVVIKMNLEFIEKAWIVE